MIRFFKQLVGLVRPRRSPPRPRLGVESLEDRLAPTATGLSLAGPVVEVNPQPIPPGSTVAVNPQPLPPGSSALLAPAAHATGGTPALQ
jgi:hypothetical protein